MNNELSPADPRPNAALPHGHLPRWEVAELPPPLKFSLRNALKTIGPGAILLAASIGGGEWIVGPQMAVKYGPTILWMVTAAVILQSIFNLEAVRYTLYTGEPIITGFMRLWPGPKFWGVVYIALGTAQLATPALAAGCANVLLAAFLKRTPDELNRDSIYYVAVAIILLTVLLLQSGKSIERVLERLSWLMMAFVFAFLVFVNVFHVPADVWAKTTRGFLSFSALPENINLVLLATFIATAGSGGLGNLVISNWFRDKGFAMGSYMGGFGSAVRSGYVDLQPVGKVFEVNPESLSRWHTWWRYAMIDQSLLWAVGCVLGMFLNVNLVLAIIPSGMEFKGYGAGTYQAEYLAQNYWSGYWYLALLNGFWILYSTHLGNTDCLVRTNADILWSLSPTWRRVSASRLYAIILVLLTIWAVIAVRFGTMLDLFKVLGVVANPILAIGAIQMLRVNTLFLPRELRPPMWRRVGLVLAALIYGGVTLALIWDELRKWLP